MCFSIDVLTGDVLKSAPPRASGGAGGTCGNAGPPLLGPGTGTRVIFFHLAGFRLLLAFGVIFLFGVGSSVSFWRWVVVFVVSAG